jgi:hypothetical protein
MVDLHGLHVEEALEYAEQAFQSAILQNDKVVRFIVGTPFFLQAGGAFLAYAAPKNEYLMMVDSRANYRQGITCEGWHPENSASFGKSL